MEFEDLVKKTAFHCKGDFYYKNILRQIKVPGLNYILFSRNYPYGAFFFSLLPDLPDVLFFIPVMVPEGLEPDQVGACAAALPVNEPDASCAARSSAAISSRGWRSTFPWSATCRSPSCC